MQGAPILVNRTAADPVLVGQVKRTEVYATGGNDFIQLPAALPPGGALVQGKAGQDVIVAPAGTAVLSDPQDHFVSWTTYNSWSYTLSIS